MFVKNYIWHTYMLLSKDQVVEIYSQKNITTHLGALGQKKFFYFLKFI